MRTVAFCEIDPWCRRILAKHWPDIECHSDIKRLPAIKADLICGGFPCQPFSTASRGRRTAENLWPFMRDVIERNQPRYVIAENVQEEAIAVATDDLRRLGYGAHYRRISGTDCGADHQRDRWWAFAYPDTQSELRSAIDAEVAELPTLCAGLWGAENYARAIRVSNGAADRVHGPGAIGNAIIPQIPEAVGRAIMKAVAETDAAVPDDTGLVSGKDK